MASNPRTANITLRKKYRARLKAMGSECGICKGKYGPIHYDEPSDSKHPLSFVIDEIRPISKYNLYGYKDRRAAAEDWNNLQAAHYMCNAFKSNKSQETVEALLSGKKTDTHSGKLPSASDGDW